MGVLKLPRLGLPWLWGPITFHVDLWLRWSLKQSCSPGQEFSNGMLHTIFTQGNRVDSWLLVVRSQTVNLTHGLSFGHNLHFRCPNESCKPILEIYVLRDFQWHEELLKPLHFNPYNRPLKIEESIGTSSLKVGVTLGMWGFIPSHFPTLMGTCGVTHRLPSWPVTLQALCLGREPKARVATHVESNLLLILIIYGFLTSLYSNFELIHH
jgi:hypothetical protein